MKFTIIGGSDDSTLDELCQLVKKLQLDEYVSFAGNVLYEQLDGYFQTADIGIGSLGHHRSGITSLASLKNREYAARGIPFIYSEFDADFDDKPFVLKFLLMKQR